MRIQFTTDATTADQALLNLGATQLTAAVTVLCEQDFLVFQKVELGMEIGPHHILWADHLTSGQDVCELAPRDHGKSMSMARAYVLWRVKYDSWVQEVLILGPDRDSAVENLDKIKEMMEGSQTLKYLIPTKKKGHPYSRSEIKLTNGKRIRAKGIGSPLRGRHPQLIVMDDVANEQNSGTVENRRELKDYVNHVVIPMKDKGLQRTRKLHRSQLVMVGTAQHLEDLYHTCLESGVYVGTKLQAITDAEKGEVLWPERYSFADLMELKKQIGALAFSKEFMNEPLSDETSIFPPSLFEPLYDTSLSYQLNYMGPLPVFLGADFSVPGSLDGDWTVVLAMTYDHTTETFTPLNYWRARPKEMTEQVEQLALYTEKYNVTLGYLEDNMFQKVYANFFKEKAVPLSGHTVHRSGKNSYEFGILSFRPLFENGRFRFPYRTQTDKQKTDQIVREFSGVQRRQGRIGNEQYHDDTVMALWHALSAARTGVAFSVSWD